MSITSDSKDIIEKWPILEAIPVLQQAITAIKQGIIVRDEYFLKKITSFFEEFDRADKAAKDAILKHADKKELGELFITYINNTETTKKAAFLGYLIKLLENETVFLFDDYKINPTPELYLRIAYLVSNIYFYDLEYLEKMGVNEPHYSYNDSCIPDSVLTILNSNGLVSIVGFDQDPIVHEDNPGGIIYQISEEGLIIKKFLIEFKRNYASKPGCYVGID